MPLLEIRPRAARNAAPLKYGVLPPELEKFRTKCAGKDKYEQLANILLLGRAIDGALLLEAVDYANKTGVPSFDKVKFFLDLKGSRPKSAGNDPVIVERCDNLEQYDTLLGRAALCGSDYNKSGTEGDNIE